VNALTTCGQAAQTGQAAQAIDFEVIVALDLPPADLRLDLTATAEIVTATRQDVLAVPILAVTVRDANGERFQAGEEEDEAAEAGVEEEEPVEVEGVFAIRGGKAEW